MKTKNARLTLCGSCRRGEVKQAADFAVVGMIDGRLPYRANLCADHLADLTEWGGLILRSCRRLTPPTVAELRAAYTQACAREPLTVEGFARMDAARNAWIAATVDQPLAQAATLNA